MAKETGSTCNLHFGWRVLRNHKHLRRSLWSGPLSPVLDSMANIAQARIRREFKEVVKSDEVLTPLLDSLNIVTNLNLAFECVQF